MTWSPMVNERVIKKLVLVLTLALICISCSTPYQRQSWYSYRGGYSETKLTDNSFRITFNGNTMTNGNIAIDFALLRSAEVAKSNGFKYFIIALTNTSTMYRETYNGIREVIGRPSVINLIYCYKVKPSEVKNKIYEVSSVINDLKNKYNINSTWHSKLLKNKYNKLTKQ